MKIENPQRIALIGYGKMGREIESVARDVGVPISIIIDTNIQDKHLHINQKSLTNVDVCIEFTEPHAVIGNITSVAHAGKNIVVGTTGWYNTLDKVRAIVEEYDIGLLYGSNFSLGMNIFYRIVQRASALFDSFDSYDCFIHEAHHVKKKDSPSGTALEIAKIMLDTMKKKNIFATGDLSGERPEDVIHISSSRGGTIPGIHTVTFDSLADTIELKHTARNRRGFAEGALIAAAWLKDKKGVFTMEDVLDDIKSL